MPFRKHTDLTAFQHRSFIDNLKKCNPRLIDDGSAGIGIDSGKEASCIFPYRLGDLRIKQGGKRWRLRPMPCFFQIDIIKQFVVQIHIHINPLLIQFRTEEFKAIQHFRIKLSPGIEKQFVAVRRKMQTNQIDSLGSKIGSNFRRQILFRETAVNGHIGSPEADRFARILFKLKIFSVTPKESKLSSRFVIQKTEIQSTSRQNGLSPGNRTSEPFGNIQKFSRFSIFRFLFRSGG